MIDEELIKKSSENLGKRGSRSTFFTIRIYAYRKNNFWKEYRDTNVQKEGMRFIWLDKY